MVQGLANRLLLFLFSFSQYTNSNLIHHSAWTTTLYPLCQSTETCQTYSCVCVCTKITLRTPFNRWHGISREVHRGRDPESWTTERTWPGPDYVKAAFVTMAPEGFHFAITETNTHLNVAPQHWVLSDNSPRQDVVRPPSTYNPLPTIWQDRISLGHSSILTTTGLSEYHTMGQRNIHTIKRLHIQMWFLWVNVQLE